jgi:chaperonin GroES
MAKDSLAQGAGSAMFMGGTPEHDAPVEFREGMVATEDQPIKYHCEICGDSWEPCRHWVSQKAEAAKPAPKSLEELAALYEPMNDRVLLRRVTEENSRSVVLPDAYKLDSDLGIVIAVGSGMLVNGQLAPIPLKLGDKVRVGHYNVEDIEVEGEMLMLVSAFDVRLKIKA